jgi:hypothetical protein
MFDLKKFKEGVPAIDKNGTNVYYLGEIPGDVKYPIVGYNDNGQAMTFTREGIFQTERESVCSLVAMKDVWYANLYKVVDDPFIYRLHRTKEKAIANIDTTQDYIKTIEIDLTKKEQ